MAGNSVAQYIIELIFKSSGTQKVLADTRQLEKVVRDYNVRAKELGKSISPKISETESWQFEYYKKALQAAGLTKYKPVLTSKGKIRWASSTGFVSKEEAASYRAFLVGLNTQTAKYDSTLAHLTRVEEKAIAAQKAHSAATYRLMKRSMQIIPIWFFMRQAFMLVINAVGDVIRTFGELENEMGRVGTVTRGFSEDNTRALEILKKAILDYSATASRGFKEAAQVMYSLGCLKPDGIILTPNGVKEIQYIRKGDKVFGLGGKEVKVTSELMIRECTEKTICKIKTIGNLPFEVTPNHPILAIRGKKMSVKKFTKSYFSKDYEKEWIKAGELKEGYYLVIPRIKETKEIKLNFEFGKSLKKNNFPNVLDEDFAKFLGIILGDGWANSDGERVGIAFGDKDIYSKRWVEKYIKKLGYGITVRRGRGCSQLIIWSRPLNKFITKYIGRKAFNKRIPSFLFKAKDSIILSFLEGYWLSDGHLSKRKRIKNGKAVRLGLTTVSPHIAYNINYLAAKLGYYFIIAKSMQNKNHKLRGKVYNYKPLYSISTTDGEFIEKITHKKGFRRERYKKVFKDDDYIYFRITSIENHKYEGKVYNFETEDNTYSTGLIVHNSAGLTVREQLGGMQHIMDLTIGTFANAEQVAKLVAGAYNVFGKSMEGAYSAAAKMKRISDILAFVYSSQQVELSQISDAMTYVASTASLMDITFTELVTTIGVLNTGMLKGSKSGTSLLNAFAQLAKQGGGLAKLDIYFDPSKPLNFSKIMDQLHKKFGDTALSASNLRILMDTFGRRGGRAVAQLISRYDEWQKSIEKTKSSFEDFALYMRVQAEDTLPKAFKRMWDEIKAKGLTQGSGLMDYIKNNILYTDILYNKLAKLRNLNVTPNLSKAINELYSSFASLKHPTIIGKQDLMNIYKIIGALQSEASVMYDLKEGLRMAAGVPSTMNIKSSADMLNTVLERVNKITDAKEREKKLEEELKVFVAYRLPMLEKDREGRKYINKLIAEREKKEGKFTNNLEKENYIINKIVTHYKEVLKQQNKIKTVTTGIDAEFKKQLEDLQKARRLSILQAEGAKQYTLHQQKIKDIIDKVNDAIDVRNEKEKDKIAHLQPQDIYNHQKLLEIASKISDQKKNLNDLYKEGTKLIADEVKEITKYSDELKSAFSKGFQDVFSGKIGLGGLFKQVSTKYREIFSKAFSEGLTDQLFAMTGLDKLFGSQMYIFRHALEGPTGKIKAAFDYGATKTYNAIVSGFNKSMGTGKRIGTFGVSTTGFTAGAGGFGGYNLPGFGAGGFFNRAVWGPTYRNATERAMAARMGHPQALTYGQLLGFGMNTAMAVQGASSAGTAAGIMGGLGSLMMGGAGIGLFAGSAGMLGALGGLLGPIGFALAIGSLIAGSLSSPPKWRREEERTTTKEITSRIDITNKQLEWVNRNLVALRQEITYIMPSSYYFRERPENEKFAIDAGRGI